MATAASVNEETVGDFRVIKDKAHELGRGMYGTVYRGVRISNNDPVAIKISTGHKQYVDLAEQAKEAELLRRISEHENIVTMHDYITNEYDDDGIQKIDFWLVTELCTHGDLTTYAYKNELSIKKKVDLMFQSGLAVQHLHGYKPEPIAHRDIKPANILITKISGKHVVRLGDFGLSRAVLKQDGRSVPMNTIAGSQPYWAPEQHAHSEKNFSYDKSVDTFSLGVSNLALLNCSKGSLMTAETVDEKPIGRALFDMHSARSRGFPFNIGRSRKITVNIDKPFDTDLVSRVKDIIKKMIVYKPAERISMNEVVARLSEIRDSPSDEVLLAVKRRSVWVRMGSVWEKQPDVLPEEHPDWFMSFCAVPDGIVAIGGGLMANVSSMCHHFSVHTRRWSRLPDMPTARCDVSVVMLGNVLMVLGGCDKHHNDLAVCEKFHMTEGVWSSSAPMLEPLYKPLLAVVTNKVYIVPRRSTISPGTMMQQYDNTADRFSRAAQLPQHVRDTGHACLVAADEKLYLLGGEQSLAVQYSPAADQWTQLLSQPPARYPLGCCGVVHDGKLLLCGGETEGNYWSLVEEFDISTQQWKITDVKLPFPFTPCDSHVVSIHV